MPTFDGDNLIMTLDAPTASVLTQNVEADWYNAWKDWMLLSYANRKYPPVFEESFGGNDLTPGVQAGAYFIFRNDYGWRIRPFEADQTIYVVGNTAPANSALPITIPTIGAYTVLLDGLQPITQNIDTIRDALESSTFVGKDGLGIFVDPSAGVDTGTPIPGNGEYPVKTESVTHALIVDRGFDNVYVKSDISLIADHSIGHVFHGKSQSINIDLGVGSDVSNCTFKECYLTGKLDTNNIIERSVIGAVTNANQYFDTCALIGPITVSENLKIEDSSIASGVTGQEITIDFNNLAVEVLVGDWSAGSIRVKNMVTGSILGVTGIGGKVIIDIANTGGMVGHAGGIFIDDAYAANIDAVMNNSISKLTWGHTAADAVEVGSMGELVNIQNKVLKNKTITDPVTGVMTVYDDDNTTILFTANIWENVAGTDPYAGNAVNRREKLA